MKVFFDNNINVKYVQALRVLAEIQGYELVHLTDKFPENTPDAEWIRALKEERDWIVVTADPRITRNRVERLAWQESGLTAFFFTDGWSQKKFWNQIADLVTWWPTIVLEARRVDAGTGFLIPVKGKVLKQIYPLP